MSKLDDTLRLLDGAGLMPGNAIIAFSGGKDSIVIAHLLSTRYGIKSAICDNSFWFDTHQQDTEQLATLLGLSVTYQDRFTDRYLLKMPSWLFQEENKQSVIYALRQQKTVKDYARKQNIPTVIYGRRTQENTVPKAIYKTSDELRHIHPIREWRHQDVWTYIRKHDLPIPRLYNHEIGKKDGSTPYNLITPSKYKRTPEQLILDFCPSTHQRLTAIGLFNGLS